MLRNSLFKEEDAAQVLEWNSSFALGFFVERHGSSLRGHGPPSRASSQVEGFLVMIGNLVIYVSHT